MTAPSAAPLLDLAEEWGGRGQLADLGGPVHWVEFRGPYAAEPAPAAGPGPSEAEPSGESQSDGPTPLVLVHGLGGSHLNWVQVAPALAQQRRVVAIDLAGFGLTPGHPRDTSVPANVALLGRFLREVVGGPAVVVGNSMGGMIALLLADTHPDLVAGLVLVDPSIPTGRARLDPVVALQFGVYWAPKLGEGALARFRERNSPRQRVNGTLKLCFADLTRADLDVVDAGVRLLAHRDTLGDADASFLAAARSLLSVLRRGRRYLAAIEGVTAPVLLLHGELDRLVPVTAARRLAAMNPSWHTEWFHGVGHTPQLEVPDRFVEATERWLHDTSL